MYWPNCAGCRLHGNTPVTASLPTTDEPILAFIGEAPGAQDERNGKPFVGEIGRLLKKALNAAGLQREDVLIANVVQCRPTGNKIVNDEVKHCFPILENLLTHFPTLKVLVPMGNTALKKMLGYGGQKKGITVHRGRVLETPYGTAIPTYHPAYSLRNPDMYEVMERDIKFAAEFARGNYEDDTKLHYETITTFHRAIEVIDEMQRSKYFAYDTETTGNRWDSDVVGFSFCAEPGRAYYIPVLEFKPLLNRLERFAYWQHEPFKRRLLRKLRQLFLSDTPKVGHNLKYDAQRVRYMLGVWPKRQVFDTMLAGHTIDSEGGPFSLGVMSSRLVPELASHKGDIKQYVSGKKLDEMEYGFGEVPIDVIGPYACGDADATYRVALKLAKTLKEPERKRQQDLYKSTVLPLMEAFARAEYRGLEIDQDHLERTLYQFRKDQRQILEELQSTARAYGNYDFNPGSPAQLSSLLYDKMGCEVLELTKTKKPSTKGRILISLILHPNTSETARKFLASLLNYRRVSKINSTYLEGTHERLDRYGCLHTDFIQHGTRTGRPSSANPNLLNLPRDTEANPWAKQVKRLFVARPGHVFLNIDYSQIELRVVAYLSQDGTMLQSYADGIDMHAGTASSIYGVPVSEVSKDQRQTGKTVNFSVIYLAGPATLRQTMVFGDPRPDKVLKMMQAHSMEDCRQYIKSFYDRYGSVKPWMRGIIRDALKDGYVETYFGRRRYITGLDSDDDATRYHAEHVAVNTPVQGTAAELNNMAFARIQHEVDNRIALPLLHIYDHITIEVREKYVPEVKQQVVDIMTTPHGGLGVEVPIEVDEELVTRWGGNEWKPRGVDALKAVYWGKQSGYSL